MSTKTYSESMGHPAFDWRQALEDMRDGKGTDHPLDLLERAKRWPFCACGNLCTVIPREEDGSPKDDRLFSLGASFLEKVSLEEWKKALKTLDKIEARAAEIIAEINRKGNAL